MMEEAVRARARLRIGTRPSWGQWGPDTQRHPPGNTPLGAGAHTDTFFASNRGGGEGTRTARKKGGNAFSPGIAGERKDIQRIRKQQPPRREGSFRARKKGELLSLRQSKKGRGAGRHRWKSLETLRGPCKVQHPALSTRDTGAEGKRAVRWGRGGGARAYINGPPPQCVGNPSSRPPLQGAQEFESKKTRKRRP